MKRAQWRSPSLSMTTDTWQTAFIALGLLWTASLEIRGHTAKPQLSINAEGLQQGDGEERQVSFRFSIRNSGTSPAEIDAVLVSFYRADPTSATDAERTAGHQYLDTTFDQESWTRTGSVLHIRQGIYPALQNLIPKSQDDLEFAGLYFLKIDGGGVGKLGPGELAQGVSHLRILNGGREHLGFRAQMLIGIKTDSIDRLNFQEPDLGLGRYVTGPSYFADDVIYVLPSEVASGSLPLGDPPESAEPARSTGQ